MSGINRLIATFEFLMAEKKMIISVSWLNDGRFFRNSAEVHII